MRKHSTHIRGTLTERFWPKVNKDGPIPDFAPELGNCWLWTDAIMKNGYGVINSGIGKPRNYLAHRVAYEQERGVIVPGSEVDHLCRVRHCIRVSHLEPVTPSENQRRGYGFSGVNYRKTECAQGHAYTEPNTYIDRLGKRHCKTCRNLRKLSHG